MHALGFLSIEDNVQIISIAIAYCQHRLHGSRSRGEQHDVISIGEGPKKHTANIAHKTGVLEHTQMTINVSQNRMRLITPVTPPYLTSLLTAKGGEQMPFHDSIKVRLRIKVRVSVRIAYKQRS